MFELILENSVKPIFYKPLAMAAFLLADMAANASMAQTSTSPYTSPLADYKPFVDEKVMSWKEANDTVGRIGGWREYLKESSVPPPAKSVVTKPVYNAVWASKAALPERLAWLEAVSKQEQAEQAKQIQFAAQTNSELTRRMRSAGNVTRMKQASQHLSYAQASVLALTTSQKALEAREKFIRVLGLNEEKAHALVQANKEQNVLPNALPELPAHPLPESILSTVLRTVSYERYASAAPSELRSSYAAYRHAYDLAKHHRDAILPLYNILAEEELLLYNGMFVGTKELLEQSREQHKAVMESIDALQQFWQAEAVFQNVLQSQQRAR